jgi:hypothetical protein
VERGVTALRAVLISVILSRMDSREGVAVGVTRMEMMRMNILAFYQLKRAVSTAKRSYSVSEFLLFSSCEVRHGLLHEILAVPCHEGRC